MTLDQFLIFCILGVTMIFFIWGRWRFDLVAFIALITAVVLDLVPARDAFFGFSDSAVVTVIMVLAISKALQRAKIFDPLVELGSHYMKHHLAHIGILCVLAAVLSAFMNNVGALSLLMPVAMQTAHAQNRSPALLLMPLSFASILGGMTTLIGTPPNIIISNYRERMLGEPFGMFDFSPVGSTMVLVGISFIILVGWRLIPIHRKTDSSEDFFDIPSYIIEVKVTDKCPYIGRTVRTFESEQDDVVVMGMIRDSKKHLKPGRNSRLVENDILILRTDPEAFKHLFDKLGLSLSGTKEDYIEHLRSDEIGFVEAVIPPNSELEGKTPKGLNLRSAHGLNLAAVARDGSPIRGRLGRVRFRQGDVLLLQGEKRGLRDAIAALGALPLAERDLTVNKSGPAVLSLLIFVGAITSSAVGALPIHVAFAAAVILLILTEIVSLHDVYKAIDWPIIVLLGSMIPLGMALESTGGTTLIAGSIIDVAGDVSAPVILGIIMVATMTLSDIMNNAATAVVMAPIAISISQQLGVNPDPFLMAVAVGASCAFLTPIGHQNNMLVMNPGGYHFGDYWKVGLPLEILIILTSIPMILWAFPL